MEIIQNLHVPVTNLSVFTQEFIYRAIVGLRLDVQDSIATCVQGKHKGKKFIYDSLGAELTSGNAGL